MIEFSTMVKALGDNYDPKASYRLIEQRVRGERLSAHRGNLIFQTTVTDPQVDDGKVFAIYKREDTKCQPVQKKPALQTSSSKTTPTTESSPSSDQAVREICTQAYSQYMEANPDLNISSAPSTSSDTGKQRAGKLSGTQTFTPSVVPRDSSTVSSSSRGSGSRPATTSPTSENSSSTPTSAESQA